MTVETDYQARLEIESKKWGDHLAVEENADELGANWLGHPLVTAHYLERAKIDGMTWPEWVREELGGPAEKSLDLGCGTADRSLDVYRAGASRYIEGVDISTQRLAEAEERLRVNNIPGTFHHADVNTIQIPPDTYDLILSYHSFHHFLELEHIMEQVHQGLTSRGLFVLEEFVGPTQFQWTDLQIELVRAILRYVPEDLRKYRMGWFKEYEGRPTPEEVVASSPFESIRSAEILPLFDRYFRIIRYSQLGGTLQQLLYNGIVHNFIRESATAEPYIKAIYEIEDTLMDVCLIPSDFMLLIGQRRDVPLSKPTPLIPEHKDKTLDLLKAELISKQNEINRMKNTLGWRTLNHYGRIKYKYLRPMMRRLGRK